MTDDELNDLAAFHCGRIEDDDLRGHIREALRACADQASAAVLSKLAEAASAVAHDFQASGDDDLDALVQQAMRDLCKQMGVDFKA